MFFACETYVTRKKKHKKASSEKTSQARTQPSLAPMCAPLGNHHEPSAVKPSRCRAMLARERGIRVKGFTFDEMLLPPDTLLR